MYATRGDVSSAQDLDQGDIVAGVLKLEPATKQQVGYRSGANVQQATDDQLKGDLSKLRIMITVRDYVPIMVVSNSCDNIRATQLVFVPIRPLVLRGATASERWTEVSQRATNGGSPKSFYLPPSPEHGIPDRMEARFDEMFVAAPSYIERFEFKRLCGLNPDGVMHLRWALGLFFGRNSRSDFAWQTVADLSLRREALVEMLAANQRPELKEELALVDQELDRRTEVQPPLAGAPPPK